MYIPAEEAAEYARELLSRIDTVGNSVVAVCPPVLALSEVGDIIAGSAFTLGAQDCFWESDGAHTGEISADDVKHAGCEYVMVGHSERRIQIGETNEMVHKKLMAVLEAHMTPVLLVGETREQYEAGETQQVIEQQISTALEGVSITDAQHILIGYEPVWAIAPSTYTVDPKELTSVISYIHNLAEQYIPSKRYHVLYGGSVNSSNIEIFMQVPGISGIVPGSASTKIDEFVKMLGTLKHLATGI